MAKPNAGLKVVVTGARGFVGMRCLPSLIESGAEVTALLRSGHDRKLVEATGATVKVAGINPGSGLQNALSGHDVLVNLAYDMRAGMAENMGMFEALLAAAKLAGISRIVHISSAVVYDNWPNGSIDETTPTTLTAEPSYRNAKIAMENRLLSSDFKVAILQPTIVYGPGSSMWTAAPLARLSAGGIILPDPIGDCPAVHVDDVARAIVSAVACPTLGQERFLISGASTLSWGQFYEGYRDILGQGQVVFEPVDQLLARVGEPHPNATNSGPGIAAKISARLRRIIGSRRFDALMDRIRNTRSSAGPTPPDPYLLVLFRGKPKISIEKARRILGYEPKVEFAAALPEIAKNHV